ncbi:uncharacterized protein [Diadema setosum]|uniref:uncharacterized protein n=1 Tax=Diadema setosum TaxID=31175 RepID=UPI003B3B7BD5
MELWLMTAAAHYVPSPSSYSGRALGRGNFRRFEQSKQLRRGGAMRSQVAGHAGCAPAGAAPGLRYCYAFNGGRCCQPRRILLVGDSLIHWVAVHARCPGELDLGLSASVTWRGRRGLCLGQLVDHVRQVLSPLLELCLSHILVHVGTNDVGRGRKRELMLLLNSTLSGVHDLLPNARLIWSNILPRREYYPYSDDDQPRIDRTRLALNKCARSICRRMGGYFVEHPEIGHEHAAVFRRDGIHLSPDGNELFLRSLSSGLANIV